MSLESGHGEASDGGKIRDACDNPIQIPGLWGLSFGIGNGTAAGGSATTLYFGAGSDNERTAS